MNLPMERSDLRLSLRIPWINTMTNTNLVKKEFNLVSCSPSSTEFSSGTQSRNLKSQAKAETVEEQCLLACWQYHVELAFSFRPGINAK